LTIFSTTSNKDRLQTREIVNIAHYNKFLSSDSEIAEMFITLNIGEHRRSCSINKKIQSGYYYLIYELKK
jgi:hypothetical protein